MTLPVKLATSSALGWSGNEFAVQVDGVTVTINASNQLEVVGGGGGITGTLTSGRVVVANGASSLTDYANFLYDGTTLTVPTVYATSQVRVGTTWTGVQWVSAGQTGTPPGTQPTGTLAMIVGNDATNAGQVTETYGTSAVPEMRLRKARGTRASPSAASASDTLGRVIFAGWESSTPGWRDVAWIDGIAYNTLGSTSNSGSDMAFTIYQSGTNATQETMRFIGGSRNGTAAIRFQPHALSSGYGTAPLVLWTMPSESASGVSAGTAYDLSFNLNRTKRYNFTGSPYASSYQVFFSNVTLSAAAATTHTKTAIVYIGVPTAGTSTTITQGYSLELGGRLLTAAGSDTQPAIVMGTAQTGIYGSSTILGFSVNGNRRGYFDSATSQFIIDNGYAIASGTSSATPNYTFGTDTNTGLQYVSADVFGVKTNGTERLRWHSDGDISIPGDVVIGAAVGTNPGYKLEVQGTFRTSGTNTLDGSIDHNGTTIGFFSATPVVQQTVGAVTNSVTSGGSDGVISDYTVVDYATDAGTIRNNLYQLGRSVAQLATAVRNLGLAA